MRMGVDEVDPPWSVGFSSMVNGFGVPYMQPFDPAGSFGSCRGVVGCGFEGRKKRGKGERGEGGVATSRVTVRISVLFAVEECDYVIV